MCRSSSASTDRRRCLSRVLAAAPHTGPAVLGLSVSLRLRPLWGLLGSGGAPRRAHALAQCSLQIRGSPILFQEIAKRFVGELLKSAHPVTRQQIESPPGLTIKSHTLSWHPRCCRLYVRSRFQIVPRSWTLTLPACELRSGNPPRAHPTNRIARRRPRCLTS